MTGDDDVSLQKAALEAQIRSRLGSRVHQFRVVCRGNGLVLQGRTQTYYAKQLAQHLVMEMTDLPILANDVEVC